MELSEIKKTSKAETDEITVDDEHVEDVSIIKTIARMRMEMCLIKRILPCFRFLKPYFHLRRLKCSHQFILLVKMYQNVKFTLYLFSGLLAPVDETLYLLYRGSRTARKCDMCYEQERRHS